MATTELVTLRHNPALDSQLNPSDTLSLFHARVTDKKRDLETYKRRKKAHEDALLIRISTENVEEVYRDFCNELDDCYDTTMLLMICRKFKNFIQENSDFYEYLFAKLASWSTHEPKMCAYIVNLLNPQQASQEEQTTFSNNTRADAVKNAEISAKEQKAQEKAAEIIQCKNILFDVITTKLNKKDFFLRLDEEHKQSESRHQTFSTDSDIVNFLISIQRPSGRKLVDPTNPWIMNQESLLKTADDMQSAIKAIDMFSWDSLTREQKFINKVIDALKASENDTITIQAGVYHRETFTFDRNQLLVLIRSNPSLCAEFKKALKQKPGMFSSRKTVFIKGSDASKMFESMDDSFVTHAKNLLKSLTLLEAQGAENAQTPESSSSASLQHGQGAAIVPLVEQQIDAPSLLVDASVVVVEESSNNLEDVVTSVERHDVSATPLTPAVEEIPSRLLDTSDQQRDVDFVPDAIHHSEDNESLPPADDIVSDDSESLPPADDIVSDDSESLPPADDIVSDENSQDPGDSASQVASNDHIIDDDKENIPHASEESSSAYLCLSIKALAEHNEVMENTKKKASSGGSFFSNSSVKDKVTHTLSSMVIS